MNISAVLAKDKKLLPALMIVAGAGAVMIGIGADFLGIGDLGGIGVKQVALAVVGFAVLLIGILLSTTFGRRHLRRWQANIASDTTPASILLIAGWFGLRAGWGEVLVQSVRIFLNPGTFLLSNRSLRFSWTVPLFHLGLFAGPGLILSLIDNLRSEQISLKSSIFVLAFTGASSLLIVLFEDLHTVAILVLAAGLAVQFARLVDRHPAGFYRIVRYSTGWPVFLGRVAQ